MQQERSTKSAPAETKPAEAKTPEKPKTPEKAVNRRRLAHEIAFVAALIGLAVLIFVLFWQARTGEERAAESDRSLYDAALNYDYARGRDDNFEARLDSATKTAEESDLAQSYEENLVKTFYNHFAKAYYYYRVGQYRTALSALNAVEDYAEDAEEIEAVLSLYYDIYTAVGSTERAASYQKLLNGDFSEIYTEEELEEILNP